MPVEIATWEAELGGSLEPGRQTLQRAKITPLHSSLPKRAKLCLKKKKELSEELSHQQVKVERNKVGKLRRQSGLSSQDQAGAWRGTAH